MKNPKFRFWLICTILWLGMIYLQASLSAEISNTESSSILELFQKLWPEMTHGALRKLAHFGEYFVLGFCALGMFYRTKSFKLSKPMLFTLLTALGDETLQLSVAGRSGEIYDIWLDFSGAFLGILFLWIIFKIRKK